MAESYVRVLRVLEYIGTQDRVEDTLIRNYVQEEKRLGELIIRSALVSRVDVSTEQQTTSNVGLIKTLIDACALIIQHGIIRCEDCRTGRGGEPHVCAVSEAYTVRDALERLGVLPVSGDFEP